MTIDTAIVHMTDNEGTTLCEETAKALGEATSWREAAAAIRAMVEKDVATSNLLPSRPINLSFVRWILGPDASMHRFVRQVAVIATMVRGLDSASPDPEECVRYCEEYRRVLGEVLAGSGVAT